MDRENRHEIWVAELKGRIAAFKEKHSRLWKDDNKTSGSQSSDTVRPSEALQSSNAEAYKASLGRLHR